MTVHLTNNFIHNIGEGYGNGAQHGVAIYLRAFFTHALGGDVTGNFLSGYQKGGIVANGRGVTTKISGNKVVGYGEDGRVKLTTLTKELFVPGFLERDEAVREKPSAKYPWDGVSGVKPYRAFASTTVVGVY